MDSLTEVKEAVVVVHGIGEQLRWQTLDSFVGGIATPGDRAPESYLTDSTGEPLRRIRIDWVPRMTRYTVAKLTTDVYEYHWAHMVQDSGWSHVSAFVSTLLRRKAPMTPRLRKTGWYLAALALPLVAGFVALLGSVNGPLTQVQDRLNTPAGLLAAFGLLAGAAVAASTMFFPIRGPRAWYFVVGAVMIVVGLSYVLGGPTSDAPAPITDWENAVVWSAVVALVLILLGLAVASKSKAGWTLFGVIVGAGAGLRIGWSWLRGQDWTTGSPLVRGLELPPWWWVALAIGVLVLAGAWILAATSGNWRWTTTAIILTSLLISLGVFATIAAATFQPPDGDPMGFALKVVGLVVGSAITGWVVFSFGDVARYLAPTPQNLAMIDQIQAGGIGLLERLHRSDENYSRIIVIGHSLGSIVAFDMVGGYWHRVNKSIQPHPEEVVTVEREGCRLWLDYHLKEGSSEPRDSGSSTDGALNAYFTAVDAMRTASGGGCWKISDLVTMAFPLAHADFVLTDGVEQLKELQFRRRRATSPPQPQPHEHIYRTIPSAGGIGTLHQTAPFAMTRWTNLYFWSDAVGGPAQRVWGPGIDDVRLETGWKFFFPLIHTVYDTHPTSIAEVRRIIHRSWAPEYPSDEELKEQLRGLTSWLRDLAGTDTDKARYVKLIDMAPLLRNLSNRDRQHLARLLAGEGTDEEVANEALERQSLSDAMIRWDDQAEQNYEVGS